MKAVVVGSTFGSVYAEGIKIADDVELAGIVGRGSKRSAALAASYGVPLYQGANAVPANIDLACVVVRSAMVGGDGVEISRSFLEKGIHVIQEQPMHSSEVLELTRCAAEHDCKFMLNGFYPYLDSVKRFIDAAASLRKEHELLSIDVTTCVQVAYPFVEVVGKVAGSLHPFRWMFARIKAFCPYATFTEMFFGRHGFMSERQQPTARISQPSKAQVLTFFIGEQRHIILSSLNSGRRGLPICSRRDLESATPLPQPNSRFPHA